jgi:hypothetical protein
VVRSHVGEPVQFYLGVAQMAARVIWDHEAVGSKPATETSIKRALGCGRSSMEEPWAVNPLVPVRLRPVTPKRMQSSTPSWRNRQTHRSQKPEPQGMSVRLGPRGPINRSPVAQR